MTDVEVAAGQMDFSVIDATLARDIGIDQAGKAERVQLWKHAADKWLAGQPRGQHFTADDLVWAVGLPDEGVGRNNVVGAWVNAQSRTGRITWTGRFRHSARVIGHRNLQRVWVKK